MTARISFRPSFSEANYHVSVHNQNLNVKVTANVDTINQWLALAKHSSTKRNRYPVFGLDTEWCLIPGGRSPLRILQLSYDTEVIIIQLRYLPNGKFPLSLIHFFGSSNNVYTGVAVRDDLDKVLEDFGIKCTGTVVDLRDKALEVYGRQEMLKFGLASLTHVVTGLKLHKNKVITLSDWGKECLDLSQVLYAAMDAYVSYLTYMTMSNVQNYNINCRNIDEKHFRHYNAIGKQVAVADCSSGNPSVSGVPP